MAKEQKVEFSPAHYVGLKIHQATETVDLYFAKLHAGSLWVTIPLHDLPRLRNEIDRKLAKVQPQDDL